MYEVTQYYIFCRLQRDAKKEGNYYVAAEPKLALS